MKFRNEQTEQLFFDLMHYGDLINVKHWVYNNQNHCVRKIGYDGKNYSIKMVDGIVEKIS